MQAWLIAKDSRSLSELFHNLRYDGHPSLWYILLFFLSRFTHDPIAMQLCHLIIASSAAYIFLRFAPFTKVQRLLFIFGYFSVYEYAVISRNYALGILFIFLFCAAYRCGPRKNYLVISAILFLLTQTNTYGILLAVSLTCMLIFEFSITPELRPLLATQKWQLVFCVCLILAGIFLSYIVMTPQSDGHYSGLWKNGVDIYRIPKTIATIWKSYVPVPKLNRYCYWESNMFPGKTLPGVLSVFLLCFVLLLFSKKRVILSLFCLGTSVMLAFEALVYLGYIRHHGHLFILLVVCLWLEKIFQEDRKSPSILLQNAADFCVRHKLTFINVLLGIQFCVGIFASGMDIAFPFSTGKRVCQYLTKEKLDPLPILGDTETSTAVIAGYLDRLIYYPRRDSFNSFVIFNKAIATPVNNQTILDKAKILSSNSKSDVLIILNYALKTNSGSIAKVKEFSNSICSNENFYLYLLKK
jgi:hypothetical protein